MQTLKLLRTRCAALGMMVSGALLLVPAGAHGARKVRVKRTPPEPGQLAISRLEFKSKNEKKPKLKLKVKNEKKLPDGIVVAAQTARVKKKGRAVAELAMANVPGNAGGVAGGPDPPQVVIVARIKQASIKFIDDADVSFGVVNTLGSEPDEIRKAVQDLFKLPASKMEVDSEGRLEHELPGLKLVGKPKILADGDIKITVSAERILTSALASGLGPPAALDAQTYGWASGEPVPVLRDYHYFPSPGEPRVVFNQAIYSNPVHGAQVSQSGSNAIQPSGAQCANGLGQFGSVASTPGPGAGTSLVCTLPGPSDALFFDTRFAQPHQEPDVIGRLLPIPVDDGEPGLGEPIGGPGVTADIG